LGYGCVLLSDCCATTSPDYHAGDAVQRQQVFRLRHDLGASFVRPGTRISRTGARPPGPHLVPEHGTVYLATADAEGRMVSFIQSNDLGFGSGVAVPGTGIALQNRALGFSLDPRHPNCVAGGKRPFHTIMPGFATIAGKPSCGDRGSVAYWGGSDPRKDSQAIGI
jgi:gamma-glutamyltranspeptidase